MNGRWLIVALVVSVALNLFLIGAGAGVIALGQQLARENPEARPGAWIIATKGLPQPDRRNFRLMLRDARDDIAPQARQSRDLRIAAWAALADPKADAGAVKRQLAQSRQIDIAVRTQVEERIVDYVIGLSPDDRRRFAAGMREALTPPGPPANAAAKR